MKVVLSSTARVRGGVIRHMEDLAVGLEAQGVATTVFAPLVSSPTPPGVPVRWRGVTRRRRHGPERWSEIVGGHTDVWHEHLADTYDLDAMRTMLRARASRRIKKVVVTEHLPRSNASDPRLEAGRRRRGAHLAKSLFKLVQYLLCDEIIVPSTSSAAFLEQRYWLGSAKVHVVHHGVAVSPDAAVCGPKEVGVASVGTLNRQKGHDVLLEACAGSSLKWRLLVIGEGSQRAVLMAAAERRHVDVEFAGWLHEPLRAVSDRSILCQPSRWESSSYAILDAMSYGMAVVATRVDGHDEIVIPGVTGFLVEPDDPDALRDAVELLLGDTRLARELGARGRQRLTSEFALERMITQTVEVYH